MLTHEEILFNYHSSLESDVITENVGRILIKRFSIFANRATPAIASMVMAATVLCNLL